VKDSAIRMFGVMNNPEYLSYMLRIWRSKTDGPPEWRVSLESPHTGDRYAFPDLKSMIQFLETQLDRPLEEIGNEARGQAEKKEASRAFKLRRFIERKRII
jgi:hypothetical protein